MIPSRHSKPSRPATLYPHQINSSSGSIIRFHRLCGVSLALRHLAAEGLGWSDCAATYPKIFIASAKAVLVQFEGLERSGRAGEEYVSMALTCPSCGNDRNFLVKTLQMHVVQLRDDSRVEASEEGRPAVIEVLCDECEKELNFGDFEENVRNELLLTRGAR